MNTIKLDVKGYFTVTRHYKAHYSLDVPTSEIMSHDELKYGIIRDERSWDELEEWVQLVLSENFIHDNHNEDFELCEDREPPSIRGVKPIIVRVINCMASLRDNNTDGTSGASITKDEWEGNELCVELSNRVGDTVT